MSLSEDRFFSEQTLQNLTKYHLMWHFIRAITVCNKPNRLGFPSPQRLFMETVEKYSDAGLNNL